MSLHAPEPYSGPHPGIPEKAAVVKDANSKPVAFCYTNEDAARIVACVNALAGIPACDLPKVRALWEEWMRGDDPFSGVQGQIGQAMVDKMLADMRNATPPLPISADMDDKVTRAPGTEQVKNTVVCKETINQAGETVSIRVFGPFEQKEALRWASFQSMKPLELWNVRELETPWPMDLPDGNSIAGWQAQREPSK